MPSQEVLNQISAAVESGLIDGFYANQIVTEMPLLESELNRIASAVSEGYDEGYTDEFDPCKFRALYSYLVHGQKVI